MASIGCRWIKLRSVPEKHHLRFYDDGDGSSEGYMRLLSNEVSISCFSCVNFDDFNYAFPKWEQWQINKL